LSIFFMIRSAHRTPDAKITLRVLIFSSLLFTHGPLHGQANGSFSGTVSDKTGSVIAGAMIKVTSQGTGVSRETKTDGSGHYLVPLLPVADYTIRVESEGFQPAERSDIGLQVDQQREIDFILTLASVTEQIEVTGTEVAVQTTNPTLVRLSPPKKLPSCL